MNSAFRVIRYTIRSTDHEKDPNNPKVPSLRYVNVLKKTMKKTLITYLNPTYLQH